LGCLSLVFLAKLPQDFFVYGTPIVEAAMAEAETKDEVAEPAE